MVGHTKQATSEKEVFMPIRKEVAEQGKSRFPTSALSVQGTWVKSIRPSERPLLIVENSQSFTYHD
jgi:hypothetical protein